MAVSCLAVRGRSDGSRGIDGSMANEGGVSARNYAEAEASSYYIAAPGKKPIPKILGRP